MRDYQVKAVDSLLASERGVCKMPTRSGKTAVGIAALLSIGLPSLFIVHTKGLLAQTVEQFDKVAGVRAGIVGGGKWKPSLHSVCMIQTLYSELKKHTNRITKLLGAAGALVVDEVHHSGTRYREVLNNMPLARYRFGLSATPFMSGKENKLETMGLIGPLVYENKMERLAQRGRIVKPKVYFMRVKRPKIFGDDWGEVYEFGIVTHRRRNMMISLAAVKMLRKGLRPLILIEKIEHGKILYDMLKDHVKVEFVWGEDEAERRSAVLHELQHGDLEILISSRIFDEGQDIPHLQCVIVAGGVKAAVRSYQRYGRGITKVEGKDETVIIDFIDDHNYILEKHSKQRLALCEKEEAFTVKVVDRIDQIGKS